MFLKAAKNYVAQIADHVEQTLKRAETTIEKPVKSTCKNAARNAEELLTPEEQRLCDMATD